MDPLELGGFHYCSDPHCSHQVTYNGMVHRENKDAMEAILKRIQQNATEFSPEWLTCDGMLSGRAIADKKRMLMKDRRTFILQWEKEAGRILRVKDVFPKWKPDDERRYANVDPMEFN